MHPCHHGSHVSTADETVDMTADVTETAPVHGSDVSVNVTLILLQLN